jgi:hypothetical protein
VTAPASRGRSSRRTRSPKTGTNARATTAVLDLVDESSEVEPDDVIDLSPPVALPLPEKTPQARRALPAPEVAREPDPRLRALGLPPDLTPPAATEDVRGALEQRLAQLPPPPPLPRTRDAVIAIVGIGTSPVAVARRLAAELHVDPEAVTLRSPETMNDLSHPDEPGAFGLSHRRISPTIVACTIAPGRAQLRWAYRILERLEPTITWAVVDASTKPEDVGHRLDLLGGVDAIALTGVADTTSPAAILRLGVPVGRIGSTPATPAVWADLLTDRLGRRVGS